MRGRLIGRRLRASEKDRRERTRSERVDRVGIVTPTVGCLGRRGDRCNRGQDRTSRRGASVRRGLRIGPGLGAVWFVGIGMSRMSRIVGSGRLVMGRRVTDIRRSLERLFERIGFEIKIGPDLSGRKPRTISSGGLMLLGGL